MPARHSSTRGLEATVHHLRRAVDDYPVDDRNPDAADERRRAGIGEPRRRSAGARVAMKGFAVLAVFAIAVGAYFLGRGGDFLGAIGFLGGDRGVTAQASAAPPATAPAPPTVGSETGRTQAAQAAAPAPVVASSPDAAAAPARPPIPDVYGLVILIRNAILALHQANVTGDYSVLREMAAREFQDLNTAARLSESFADLRARGLHLDDVAFANPRLYSPPSFDDQGMLRLAGTFDADGVPVNFLLAFQWMNPGWRLFGIGLTPANPDAKGRPPAVAESASPALPEASTMVALIRSSIVALNQANMTGNYSVLRELGAPGFQEGNTFARLSAAFADLRARHIDLGAVAVIDPHLFRPASIDDHKMLRLTGFFPSRPEQVNFDLAFQLVKGEWRLFGIGVNTSREAPERPVAQSAAQGPQAAAAEPATAKSPGGGGLPPEPRLRPQ